MNPDPSQPAWQMRLIGSRLPWGSRPVRPAEVSEGLCDVMVARQNTLEDVNYQKIVPNQFVVELSQGNYSRNYQPIEDRILQQWNQKLMDHIMTANSRQGRMEYRFGGPLKLEIRPVEDLREDQARLYCRVQSEVSAGEPALLACLEILPGGKRISLKPGITTIGRNPHCDVYLDSMVVQEKRLISGEHAYLHCQKGNCRIYDGSPDGKLSVNGTFVSSRRVPPAGLDLHDGDLIILAALDARFPREDTPGVAALRFSSDCKQ